jgi:ADP-heptose:LPS heptosyltransferase
MEKDIKKILLIMVHSAGVGDMLRTSASWRALKNKFPTADLHLLFPHQGPRLCVRNINIKTPPFSFLSHLRQKAKRSKGLDRVFQRL